MQTVPFSVVYFIGAIPFDALADKCFSYKVSAASPLFPEKPTAFSVKEKNGTVLSSSDRESFFTAEAQSAKRAMDIPSE